MPEDKGNVVSIRQNDEFFGTCPDCLYDRFKIIIDAEGRLLGIECYGCGETIEY